MPLKPLTMTRLMLRSHRAPLTRSPGDVGLAFEDVAFAASDGVGAEGLVRAGQARRPRPRSCSSTGGCGTGWATSAGQTLVPDRDVDFLPAIKALRDAGYHMLLFDLRGHGESADANGPQTYRPMEARDFVGAVAPPAHPRRTSSASGSARSASPPAATRPLRRDGAQPIKAVLAVQPTRLRSFNPNFAAPSSARSDRH